MLYRSALWALVQLRNVMLRTVSAVAAGAGYLGRGDRTDFFISHAGADRAWAEWIAWQLTDAGYTVELDAWDWAAGQNFVLSMNAALARCDRVLALFSRAYFERPRYTTDEWSSALLHDPDTGTGRLLPIRIEEVPSTSMPPLLRPMLSADISKLDADRAKQALLSAANGPKRPDGEPVFPGSGRRGALREMGGSGPRLPGTLPRIWNLPARNPSFTGRDELLVAVRKRLTIGDRAVVQAFQGMGGIGKTQLATEYAYRFAGSYDLAWWIDSEQPGLIGDQFAALGTELGCAEAGAKLEVMRSAVLAELRDRGQWLLVFDNAETAHDIRPWLPGGNGDVLITSREYGWGEIATTVEVDLLSRPESIAMLRDRVANLGEADASLLAERLGDLPLAVAQAAGFMAETGMPAADYLKSLATHAARLLEEGVPGSYPHSLAAATRLAMERLESDDLPAAELAELCAFLGPEPIPDDIFTNAADELPDQLAARARDPLAWRQTLRQLARRSLARVDHRGVVMHRLTQGILRDRFATDQASEVRRRSEAILAAGSPSDPTDPATWARWAQLMPHLLVSDMAATSNSDLRWMACDACWYLLARGETQATYDLTTNLRQYWLRLLGNDHRHTLAASDYLALALSGLGRYAEARDLDQDTLSRRRRIFGDDHPDTLASATNFANRLASLGDVQAAHDLERDTLERSRRVLGDDHPDTLKSASNLASRLSELGDAQAARDLEQDALDRRRRILGDDHPDTLVSANNLAVHLVDLGEVQAARDLDLDTLDRRRRILGDDHPNTLNTVSNLAVDLATLGDLKTACELEQDALERRRRILGDDHPNTLKSVGNLAKWRRMLGETKT